ncbi:LrgB family protein [Alteromonas oceanisediminis]|uniref:LrgB family protein n=1 Tax=Alteromonas oceanisediminis TaxID=2836180 RepID=UPI001BDB324B|nr:LrgB family protein [Alteromonas oceanisediminis]MBT0585103.1 LrgB family protein [Alteromonas oceanisediminis]
MNSAEVVTHAALWTGITIVLFLGAMALYRKTHALVLLHPLLVTVVILFAVLQVVDVSIAEYQQHAVLLDFLLGPATVALAIPLFRQIQIVRALGLRVVFPILVGGVVAPLMAWASVALLGASETLQMTMLVKSITTPLAIDVAVISGGIPALAAAIVIITGIVGAIAAPWVFSLLQVQNRTAQGVALGTVAHAVGTSSALHMHETTAAMATLALCVNGVFTALVLPLLFI